MESISVVILSLMRLGHTRRCIDALYLHTQQPFELIIVDMGVDEEVCSFLEELAGQRENVQIVFNAENIGTTRGRNQGSALAHGDWLVFLDNDAEVTEGWREALLRGASEPGVGVCVPRLLSPHGNVLVAPPSLVSIDEDGRVSKIGFRFERLYEANDPVVSRDCVVPWYPTTCLMVRRTLFEEIGGFDEGIFLAEEDKDLCLSIREKGYQIVYAAASEVIHGDQEKAPEYRAIRDNLMVLKQDIDYFETKWNCEVVMECRRSYLRELGMSEKAIDLKKRLDFFSTVLEDGDSLQPDTTRGVK